MQRLSLKMKLLFLSFFLVGVSVFIGGMSYYMLQQVVERYGIVAHTSYPKATALLQMLSNFRYARILALEISSEMESLEERKHAAVEVAEVFAKDADIQKQYMAIDFLPGEEVLYKELRVGLDLAFGDIKEAVRLFNGGATLDDNAKKMLAKAVFTDLPEHGKLARVASAKIQEFHFKQAEAAIAKADVEESRAKILIPMVLVFGCSLGLLFSILFSNSLVKLLTAISSSLDQSSSQVSAASTQIAASSEGLSQAASEQAASLEETSAAIEQLSSMVAKNADNAKSTAQTSMQNQAQAEKGRGVVDEMIKSMTLIDESNQSIMQQVNISNEQMAEIVKVIQGIESKTKVINDIVFQTKLLSFNASVEAARAGEQGKGFAVVAEEVGNLAQMSGRAAQEISDMLADSVKKVESIATDTKEKVSRLIQDGQQRVKAGSEVANECGNVLSEIVTSVAGVAKMASEISSASEEQAKGLQEITKAVSQMDEVTQTNSSTSQEAASAAEELSAQAKSLKDQVVSMVRAIRGGDAPGTATARPSARPAASMQTSASRIPVQTAAPKARPRPEARKVVSLPAQQAAAEPVKKVSGDAYPSPDHSGFEEI